MSTFTLVSDYKPAGDQPQAIEKLVQGVKKGGMQTLLGVTGSGKTFSIANVIQKTGKKTLVLSHNKTLAAQLYGELKQFFPNNHVGYFVSYYDYYQPESYIPQTDTYIEKDVEINEKIEQMRVAATANLLSHDDVIIVATVSAIYGLGSPEDYLAMSVTLTVGQKIKRTDLLRSLIKMQYERNDMVLEAGNFRAKGDTIDVFLAYESDRFLRISLFGDEVESISEHDVLNGHRLSSMKTVRMYPAKHFVVPPERIEKASMQIREELAQQLPKLGELERHRLKQRTEYDLELIRNTGHCKGIENYSRYFDLRQPGEKPYCLLDFFGNDFLLVVDESHISLPQVSGMQKGDHSRKKSLVDYGFRLPSAYDNRPLTFTEFEKYLHNSIFVSATPADYEHEHSAQIVEQLVRPTGLLDPQIVVRPTTGQMDDLKREIQATTAKGWRTFVTTITKRMAEDLSDYLIKSGIRARYLHSEIETLQRTELIRQLRLGDFDVLVGINLLREGLDVPEVALVAVLDADKEGFLRNERSLVQVFGRCARNLDGHVVMYAERMTDSMKGAISETTRRRAIQEKFNIDHHITPTSIKKAVEQSESEVVAASNYSGTEIAKMIVDLQAEMEESADSLDFEKAIELRDKVRDLKKTLSDKEKYAEWQARKIESKIERKAGEKIERANARALVVAQKEQDKAKILAGKKAK